MSSSRRDQCGGDDSWGNLIHLLHLEKHVRTSKQVHIEDAEVLRRYRTKPDRGATTRLGSGVSYPGKSDIPDTHTHTHTHAPCT